MDTKLEELRKLSAEMELYELAQSVVTERQLYVEYAHALGHNGKPMTAERLMKSIDNLELALARRNGEAGQFGR